MKKLHSLWFSFLLAAGACAQDMPPVTPMPELPADLPPGANPAAYPEGKFDWFQRVKTNIDNGKKAAADCQLIFDGDSITDFWPKTGKEIWAQDYAKYNAFDFAIAGDQTQHLLWRLSQGQAEGMHPKLIVLLIGTNNMPYNTPDQIAEGVKDIIAVYRQRCPDVVILLQGIFPHGEKPDDPIRAKIKQTNEIISKLGDGQKVIYLDFGDKFLQADGTITHDIMTDFIHPSAKGYQIWADAIQPIIDQYLAAK